MKTTNVADLVVDILQQVGVTRIFGLASSDLNDLIEAVRQRGLIDRVNVRKKDVAAFAAGVAAQVRDELAACADSCGLGNLHLVNGLYDCQCKHAPVLAIAAHSPWADRRAGGGTGTAGGATGVRRRLRDADGRHPHSTTGEAAGEGGALQQRHAGPRGGRDERGRLVL